MYMKISKAIFACIFSIICITEMQAQVNNTDSIDKVLKSMKDDTAKVNLLNKTGQMQLNSFPDKVYNYAEQAIEISKKINYPLGLANGYYLKNAYYLNIKTDLTTSAKYLHLADSIYQQHNEPAFILGKGLVLLGYGAIQQYEGNYLEAIKIYINASAILESINNKNVLPYIYYNLSALYQNFQQFEKQEFYAKACLKVAEETKLMSLVLLGGSSLAAALIYQKKYEQALPVILKSKKIAEITGDHIHLSLCYTNLSMYYDYKKDYTQAIINGEKALEQAKLVGRTFEEINNLGILSLYYYANKQFEKAKTTANKANEMLQSFKSVDLERSVLASLAKIEAHFGEYKNAYEHLLHSSELKDTVFKEENKRQINYLDALYQSEKKEKEINQLHSERKISELTIKKRNVIIYTLFTTIILLMSITLLIYRNIRNKRKIAEQDLAIERQKIKELEKDRQIVATHAVLLGEEMERQRLARDLHDGLGGLLSGVKFNLSNIKGNYVLDQEQTNHFTHALSLLDNSIFELRRIAHNMMPESLVKFGLKDALQDFCSQIEIGKKIKIQFHFFGEEKRIESSIENTVYKITHELINNALKHAEASELLVQIIHENTRIHLTVQDNGKGFDPSIVDATKSAGLKNIRARVESFNGNLDIVSEPGKGTEISVEFITG
jgi:two-component system, NarL family, sensor kinase